MVISKGVRITGYVVLFFVVLVITTGLVLNFYFNKKIIELAKEQISKSTKGEYVLSIDELSTNLFTQSLTFNNLQITPAKKITSAKSQYIFKLNTLKVVNFSITSYFKEHDVLIEEIKFGEVQISVFQGAEKLPKDTTLQPEKDVSAQPSIAKKLNSISVGNINIVNSKINIYKHGAYTLPVFTSNDNNLSVQGFSLNLNTTKDSNLFSVQKFEVAINNFYYKLDGGLYTAYGKRLYASYNESALIIDSLKLIPNFSITEFSKKAQNQVSRSEIITSKINCKKINFDLLFNAKKLEIDKVEITGSAINVFRDNTYPLAKTVRPSLQAMVKNLPFNVLVDTVEMKNATLHFEGLTPAGAPIGKISVTNMNIIVAGIQSDSTTYTETQSIVAVISGSVLNEGNFIETCTFPLKYTEEFFYCSGGMSAMPLTSFNPVLKNTKLVQIKSGQLDTISFSFVANNKLSVGTMRFLYHDLSVEMLNFKDDGNNLKQKVETYIANNFMMESSNPNNGVVRISKIHAVHNPYRFFINYSMQSILSGIEPAIVGEENTARLKKRNK